MKTTAFDLQVDPSAPGLRFHKLDRAKDRNSWSVRVGGISGLSCTGPRRASSSATPRITTTRIAGPSGGRSSHLATGAAQLVELPERVEEAAPAPAARTAAKPLIAAIDDAALLSYGVPPEWLPAVRAATADTLFDLAPHLPQEAAEALLDLATGTTPQRPKPAPWRSATTRCCRSRSGSRRSPTTPISRRCSTPSATSSTSPAQGRDHLLVTGVEPVSEFLDDLAAR